MNRFGFIHCIKLACAICIKSNAIFSVEWCNCFVISQLAFSWIYFLYFTYSLALYYIVSVVLVIVKHKYIFCYWSFVVITICIKEVVVFFIGAEEIKFLVKTLNEGRPVNCSFILCYNANKKCLLFFIFSFLVLFEIFYL